jgi:hypothetical protein
MILFNISDLTADIMGSNIIEGIKLAYPSLVDVHRFNSTTLSPERVYSLMEDDYNFQVVVCGPVGLNSRVVDMLTEFGGSWGRNIRILSGDRYN